MSALTYALRSLRRSPWHAGAVVLIVAFGIALATTVIALVDGVLFKPLPYDSSDDLYFAGVRAPGEPGSTGASPADIAGWRAAAPEASFTALHGSVGLGTLGIINGPLVWSRSVESSFWDVVGVRPLIGGFESADYTPDRFAGPAILSYGLWQRVFDGSADVIGRRIPVDRFNLRVAGVMPRDFVFPATEGRVPADIILPIALAPQSAAEASRYLDAIVRMPSQAAAPVVGKRLQATVRRGTLELTPLDVAMTTRERPAALLLFGAAAVVVILVALNIGGLFASRSLERAREFATRRALGADGTQLAMLQIIEAALLVGAGTVAGALAARPLLAMSARLLPPEVVLLREPVVDGRVIALIGAVAAMVAACVAAGGIRVARRASLIALVGAGAGSHAERTRSAGRFIFVAAQVAIALLLVLGGALFVSSIREVWSTPPGFAVEHTYFFDVRPGGSPGRERDVTRVLAIADALASVPGVERAAAIDTILLSGARRGSPFRRPASASGAAEPELMPVSPGFFDVTAIAAVAGRLPSESELRAGAPVAAVSERAAEIYWPGADPLGQVLESNRGSVTVVGVVPNGRYQRLDRESDGEVFAPLAAGLRTSSAPTFLITSRAPEHAVLGSAIEAIRRIDPAAQIRRAESMSSALAHSVQRRRFHAWLFGGFSVAGLTLAGLGVFGMLAAATSRRTHEIGIRMALGATARRVVRMIVTEQLRPVLAGLAAGALIAAWAVRFVQSLLYGVQPFDPLLWLFAAVVVTMMAAVGALVPAASAARTEPARALKAN